MVFQLDANEVIGQVWLDLSNSAFFMCIVCSNGLYKTIYLMIQQPKLHRSELNCIYAIQQGELFNKIIE